MPPTTSAPISMARVISSRPLGYDSIPLLRKGDNLQIDEIGGLVFTASSASQAASDGSVTSTWVRTCWTPKSRSMPMVFSAR